jgi:hypothetical protein
LKQVCLDIINNWTLIDKKFVGYYVSKETSDQFNYNNTRGGSHYKKGDYIKNTLINIKSTENTTDELFSGIE